LSAGAKWHQKNQNYCQYLSHPCHRDDWQAEHTDILPYRWLRITGPISKKTIFYAAYNSLLNAIVGPQNSISAANTEFMADLQTI
jgi:hypothetical protein